MTRKAIWVALLVAAAIGTMWVARRTGRPNVLLITIDALRPDYVSCYGGSHRKTPHIDALAADGVLFTDAVSGVPWTRGSMASVMTGLYPAGHQVRTPFQRLDDPQRTMAEAFQAAGYQTGAVVSIFQLDHVFQLDQGFSTYDDRCTAQMVRVMTTKRPLHVASVFYGDLEQDASFRRSKQQMDAMRDDATATDVAVAWLQRATARPFFLWVHYFGAHELHEGESLEFDLFKIMQHYEPAVTTADKEVGRLLRGLEALGLARNTLVVLHADHGQSLLDHGSFGFGDALYETNVHVPLIMRWPAGLTGGREVTGLIGLVDLFPTIAGLVGLHAPSALDGRDLTGLVRGTDDRAADDVYLETYLSAMMASSQVTSGPDGQPIRFGFVRRGLRDPRWKYIRNEPVALVDVPQAVPIPEVTRQAQGSEELYDLQHDPGERKNLIAEAPDVAANLRARIARYAAGTSR